LLKEVICLSVAFDSGWKRTNKAGNLIVVVVVVVVVTAAAAAARLRVCVHPHPPPPKNVTIFHSKLLLDNSACFTSSSI